MDRQARGGVPRTLLLRLWCLALTGVVFWPFLATLVQYLSPGDAAPGSQVSLILRDMVVPHSMALNDLATGRDGLPRAVPQDTVLAFLSPVVPPPVVVGVLMLAAGYGGAVGAAALAGRFSPVGAFLAPVLTLWNPFVAERLLQGHWSVVLAGVLLPAVALAASRGTRRSLAGLVLLMLVCALTPTGLILATVTALVAALCTTHRRRLTGGVVAGAAVVFSLPWVVPTLVHAGASASLSDAAGAAQFAARAEPAVGTLGALAGLGGIWNAGAVPGSRDAFAPVSTWAGVVLALVAVCVAVILARRRTLRCAPLVWLSLAAVVLPALAATSPGLAVTGWFIEHVPGAGLLRDTQKFVVLALPGLIVLLAQGATLLREVSRTAAATGTVAVLALTWVGVPALPRDVGDLSPVALDADYAQLVDEVEEVERQQNEDSSSVRTLLWPPGSYRMIGGRPALDPLLKMLPGAPVDPGYLIVDGRLVDGDADTVRMIGELADGNDTLAAHGVDLVVVGDGGSDGPDTDAEKVWSQHEPVWSSGPWRLYRVN